MRNFKTDALARVLVLHPVKPFLYRPEPTPSKDELERETDRLDALPRDEQTVIYCAAMGFDVREFLREQGRYMYEASHGLLGMEASL